MPAVERLNEHTDKRASLVFQGISKGGGGGGRIHLRMHRGYIDKERLVGSQKRHLIHEKDLSS